MHNKIEHFSSQLFSLPTLKSDQVIRPNFIWLLFFVFQAYVSHRQMQLHQSQPHAQILGAVGHRPLRQQAIPLCISQILVAGGR